MTPKQWISGIVQNLYTVLEGVFAKKSDVHTVTSGEFVGSMYRTNVSGSGKITVNGTTGIFPTVPAGTYRVKTYMLSNTASFTLSVSFGGETYQVSTTTGEAEDSRELTFASSATWSGSITTVSSNTRLRVQVYSVGQIVTVVGPAAVSNDYNDLDNKPTNVSSFTNDSGYLTSHQDISGKQDVLVSGTNIKTINSTSLLGSGNLDLVPKSGGTMAADALLSFESNADYTHVSNGRIEVSDTAGEYYVDITPGVINVNDDDDLFAIELDSTNARIAISVPGSTTHYLSGGIVLDNNDTLLFPQDSGTLALTTDIPSALSDLTDDVVSGHYMPLTGGTATGAITVRPNQIGALAYLNSDGVYVSSGMVPIGNAITQTQLGHNKITVTNGNGSFDLSFPAVSGTIALTSDIPSVSGKEDTTNKVTSLSSSSTDTQYPSAKCVYDLLGDVETLINAL